MNQKELCQYIGCSKEFLYGLRRRKLLNPSRVKVPGAAGKQQWIFGAEDIERAKRIYERNTQKAKVSATDPLLNLLLSRILAQYGTWSATEEKSGVHYNHLLRLASGDKPNPTLKVLNQLAALAGGKITFVEDLE